ncbi:condensation domain-containing protein [Serratia fonticola]|uniref:condensation domain-containing protein n=1 Tax=Serratia fonticola TaxID=47917 RepID=UPI0021777133|nr:condensation domain-containing protein [Serratia fonticola]CAI0877654.1 Linear gramicidin synthase subunit B [Serratia fonticola]CAI0911813.1 Linear gramicidin synthase subunit B [Serratia fonticola]
MTINIAPFQYHVLECEKIALAEHRNVAILYDLPDDITNTQVKMAVLGVFKLFPALNSVFEKTSGEWKAFLVEQDFSTRYSEVECADDENFMEVASQAFHDYNCHLNLSNGPLSRFLLIKKGSERKILFLGNHLIYDQLSLKNIAISMWKLLYNKTAALPQCRFLNWTTEISHYFNNNFNKDIPYWLDTDWGKSAHIPAFKHQDIKPATRISWKYQFSLSSSQVLLSAVGGSVALIDILLAKLNLAVSEFMSSSSLAIELWDNGRESLRDRSSVGPYACFWPLLIEQSSGSLLNTSKNIARIRATTPPKHGYLLGLFKKGDAGVSNLFQKIPSPQFKVNFLGNIPGKRQNMNELSRMARIATRIPIDHSAYSHISIIFSVEDGIVTMNWSHSSAAYSKDYLQQIAKLMTEMPFYSV